jgi:hypothetical protein
MRGLGYLPHPGQAPVYVRHRLNLREGINAPNDNTPNLAYSLTAVDCEDDLTSSAVTSRPSRSDR